MLRLALFLLLTATALAQTAPLDLYRALRSAELDPQEVYRVREAGFDLEDIHITLVDGTIAFTRAVDGRVTGAFFEGEADVLLVPPDNVERTSLAMHTGAAVLEERFTTAFFRFTDDLPARLQDRLREPEEPARFLERWGPAVRSLAEGDALPLLVAFTRDRSAVPMRYFRARLGGSRVGTFDLRLDTRSPEQIWLGQVNHAGQTQFYDVWASFPMRTARKLQQAGEGPADAADKVRIPRFQIVSEIVPPTELRCQAALTTAVEQGGDRVLILELSRNLAVSAAAFDGAPVDFIQNEALRGSELERRGNDLVAVILPQPLRAGSTHELRFTYSGAALSDAGGGLMYVGSRGTWYPNLGPAMARFDLQFRHPADLTLVATGERMSEEITGEQKVTRWVSEQPVPVAGFNLGRYKSTKLQAGEVTVEAFAAEGMESAFPGSRQGGAAPPPREARPSARTGRRPMPSLRPQPASHLERVAQASAEVLEFLHPRIGPLPFRSLALTQMPGRSSHGWPGLVFLSSYVFLSPGERQTLRPTPIEERLYSRVMLAHEVAHQWWGDTVSPRTYRDQWVVEALANYTALLALEPEHPDDRAALLARYREVLLEKNEHGVRTLEAGPVVLGPRLASSKAPAAYDAVLYGRGTWLLHMLRSMLRDAAGTPGRVRRDPDALFYTALRNLVEPHAGGEISTADLQRAFEAVLPRALYFEDKKSLDWFFEGWVNGTAVPRFELQDVRIAERGGRTVATGTLRQTEAPRDLVTSVPLFAQVGPRREFVSRIFAEGEETQFRIAVPAGAVGLLLDPEGTILRREAAAR